MHTIVKEVIIPDSEHMYIEVELPAGFPVGKAIMTLEPKNMKESPVNRSAEMCGKGKGKVWIANDFDEPLNDFAEYM